MQIHEITLTEAGILQGIKRAASGVQGAVAGYKQSQQQRKLQDVSARAVKVWNNYAQQLKASTTDPVRYKQLYQQALVSFVQKNLLKGTTINQAVNQREIVSLIRAIADQADNPTAVTQLFTKLVQQSAIALPDTERGGSPILVKVVSTNPAVLQFRNKTYIIGNQGEWVDQATGKVADQSFQAFLDQQLAQAEGQP